MDDFISYLMGASQIADSELTDMDIEIVGREGTEVRMINIPANSLKQYKDLVKMKLDKGYWNDIIGKNKVLFIFKFADETTKEYTLDETNRFEIAQYCSKLNNDPIEKTSDIYNYLAANDFYRERINKYFLL